MTTNIVTRSKISTTKNAFEYDWVNLPSGNDSVDGEYNSASEDDMEGEISRKESAI